MKGCNWTIQIAFNLIVLDAKPHQEYVTNIDAFISMMCVSYCELNRITKPFQYHIPRCDDLIYILSNSSTLIFIIPLDARQGYYQISLKVLDLEKLSFFSLDDYKYCYTVMPFCPTNAPTFYTATICNFKKERDELFLQRVGRLNHITDKVVKYSSDSVITMDGKEITAGSKSITDDILLWCFHEGLVIMYFECVYAVFQKYHVRFKLSKCKFLSNRVEYVGHDLLRNDITPAKAKFDLINDWDLLLA